MQKGRKLIKLLCLYDKKYALFIIFEQGILFSRHEQVDLCCPGHLCC